MTPPGASPGRRALEKQSFTAASRRCESRHVLDPCVRDSRSGRIPEPGARAARCRIESCGSRPFHKPGASCTACPRCRRSRRTAISSSYPIEQTPTSGCNMQLHADDATAPRSRRLSLRLRARLCSPARTPRCRSSSPAATSQATSTAPARAGKAAMCRWPGANCSQFTDTVAGAPHRSMSNPSADVGDAGCTSAASFAKVRVDASAPSPLRRGS